MFKNVFWREEEPSPREVKPEEGKPKKEEKEEKEEEEEYDPYAHRDVKKPTSDIGALAHLLKTSLGSGILAMPMAFKHAGLALGAAGTLFIGLLCTHCVYLLVRNAQYLCKVLRTPSLSFPKTVEMAFKNGPVKCRKFGKAAGVTITTQLLASFILGNTVYIVFIAHTMFQVVEFYWDVAIDTRLYTLTMWLPLILLCMMPNLKSLVPFSLIANIFVLVSFSITMYYIFRDTTPEETVVMVAPVRTWCSFLATVVFAVEGIGTVLPIENEMKHPEHFLGARWGVLYTAMTIVISLYSLVGFFGYLEYGQKTKGSITLNLPIKETLAQMVKILIALAIFITYGLQFYVPIRITVDLVNSRLKEKYHRLSNILVRVVLVTLTVIMSVALPHLEAIISLVGAVCFSMLGLLFPALIDIMTRYPNFGFGSWKLWKNIFIIILSLVVLVSGTYIGLAELIQDYDNGRLPRIITA